MGCSRKAIEEDEEDWDRFCDKYGLGFARWDVYSSAATIAQDLVRKYPHLRDHSLYDAVELVFKIENLNKKCASEADEYQTYLKLKNKFENK